MRESFYQPRCPLGAGLFLCAPYGPGSRRLAATWSEGDWNADGVFTQVDIIAALATGNYLQGPYVTE